jgi:hypothetical protein
MRHQPTSRSGRIGVLAVIALAAISLPCLAWQARGNRLGLEFLGGHSIHFEGHGGPGMLAHLRRHLGSHFASDPHGDERWETELEQRFTLDRSVKGLRLHTRAGALRVLATEGEELIVRARIRADLNEVVPAECTEVFADHVAVETGGGWLDVRDARSKSGRGGKGWSIGIDVYLPRALALDVATQAGAIAVTSATGEVKLHSGAGAIELKTAARLASLELSSSAGTIAADLGGVEGKLALEASAGSVQLELGHKGAKGDLSVTTRAGSVSVKLPRDASGYFRMSTSAGALEVDPHFGLQVRRRAASASCEGQVGVSDAKVTIETGAGSIEVESRATGFVY